METKLNHEINGQEVSQDDFSLVAEEASLATDWLLAELLRPGDALASGQPCKYVIVGGGRRRGLSVNLGRDPLITSTGVADGSVKIRPFTAVIGSRTVVSDGVDLALRDIRTARHQGDPALDFHTKIQFPVPVAERRWDLIYARIDIDLADATVQRFVKTGAAQAVSQDLVVTRRTVLTLGRVTGVEDSLAPPWPTLPADGGGAYYIALAYVSIRSAHTLTSTISVNGIHEVYEPLTLSTALGGSPMRVANGNYKVDGASFINEGDADGILPPTTYLPSGMVGSERLLIPIRAWDGTSSASVLPNVVTILDDSIDWRQRLFMVTVALADALAVDSYFQWAGNDPVNHGGLFSALGSATQVIHHRVGQSFNEDLDTLSGGAVTNGAAVLYLTDTDGVGTGAILAIYVDRDDGALKCWRNNVDAASQLMVWLEATAPFINTSGTA